MEDAEQRLWGGEERAEARVQRDCLWGKDWEDGVGGGWVRCFLCTVKLFCIIYMIEMYVHYFNLKIIFKKVYKRV